MGGKPVRAPVCVVVVLAPTRWSGHQDLGNSLNCFKRKICLKLKEAKRCTLFQIGKKKFKNVCPKLRSLISKLSSCPHRWRCLLKGAFLWEATLLPFLSNPPCFRPQKDADSGLGLDLIFSTS